MVPALPSFKLHKFVSEKLVERNLDYRTGVVYTTNRRVWEHDEEFKTQLAEYTPIAIDMETATIFVVGPQEPNRPRRAAAGLRPADDARGREDLQERRRR